MRKESMPKLLTMLRHYSMQQFSKDVVAGVIVAIIALPLSIALALASGVGPEEGIYTAIVGGFVIAMLGGSPVQISGPTAAFATIVAGIVATKGMEGLVVATILAGVILAVGRIVGETAALIYTAGTVADIPKDVMSSGRTLAVHMYNLASEGLYMDQAYATAVILLVLVVGINALSGFLAKKLTKA